MSFRADPRQGYLDHCTIVVSYLEKFKHTTIRIRTEEPDLSFTTTNPHDWEELVYGKVKELTPHDAPASLGKDVVTISYYDANLFHNSITGRSVTGALHMLNNIPIDWCSKKKSTVEKRNIRFRSLVRSNLCVTDLRPSYHLVVLRINHPQT